MTTHRTDVCICGAVQYDCPCPGPKPTVVVQHVCQKCVANPARTPFEGDEFDVNTPSTDDPCMTEEEAASNRAVRLAVFEVLSDFETNPRNPQVLIAEVHAKMDVPERWEQLARDLITEALAEKTISRRRRSA